MKSYFECKYQLILCSCIFLGLYSCSTEEKIDTSEFLLEENHKIELVASEPDVILPVAIAEDSRNRLWVVEMPGYMRDIDGSDEDLTDGRIVILTDNDQDGKIDRRKLFLDGLLNPRAICHLYGGLLFTDGTMLKWTEIKDDTPRNTIVVDSFYVVGGNIEHQPNGLLYNLDNWIYSAKSYARYCRIGGKWIKEATTFRGQWGISMDRMGRLIYNHNSAPLMGDHLIPNQTLNNPYLKLENIAVQYLTDDMRIFPIQATSVNRGYLPDVLDSLGKIINYTSACAPHIYYGDQLDEKYNGSAFVCAPEGNLISSYSYDEDLLEAERMDGENEFLVSRDETFRPVNLITGLDGSLYVVDMRKGIIQHSAYMSSYLRDAIDEKGLEKVNGKGRIYRISRKDKKYMPKKLNDLNSDQLINLFSDPNLQVRMFAQKELVGRNDDKSIEPLISLAKNSNDVNSTIHALWTLEGMNALSPVSIVEISQSTNDINVLSQLIVLSKLYLDSQNLYDKFYTRCLQLNSPKLDLLLASINVKTLNEESRWLQIANKYLNNNLISESLVSSISGRESYFLSKFKNSENDALKDIITATLANKISEEIQAPTLIKEPFDDDRTNGLKKYRTNCAACHGLDGKGQTNVAPPFKNSSIIQGDDSAIAKIILNGYDTGNGNYEILMPAYKENKNLTNQDINDIISYLKSTFTEDWNSLMIEDIEKIRQGKN